MPDDFVGAPSMSLTPVLATLAWLRDRDRALLSVMLSGSTRRGGGDTTYPAHHRAAEVLDAYLCVRLASVVPRACCRPSAGLLSRELNECPLVGLHGTH